MEDQFLRKPSCLESFFMDLDDCGCNMTFHYFLQLGQKPDTAVLNQALSAMLDTHLGMNLRYFKRGWYISRELDPCQIVELEGEDVYNSYNRQLDFRRSTLGMNVVHTQADQWFLCFDFFHGAVDGRSGVQFIYDFFSQLNGNASVDNEFVMAEADLVAQHGSSKEKLSIPHWPICQLKDALPKSKGEMKTFVLRTMACTRSMGAKLASAVGQCFTDQRANMIIPVDVRRFANTKKTLFGNLIVPIFVDANSNRKIEDLRSEIINYVKQDSLLAAGLNSLFFYNKLPQSLRVFVIGRLLPLIMLSKKFICCALVSPIGEVESKRLQAPQVQVEDVMVTFVSFPFTAFTVASVQYDGHTNTTVCWHSGRVSQKTADRLIHNIDRSIRT